MLKSPLASTAQLYEKLRSVSAKGNNKDVEQIVGALLQEHHEAPNLHLYTASILSNIDPRNGSAAKAARLWQEMTEEGIVAESSTYHALLKVVQPQVHGEGSMLTSPNIGSCNSSELQPAE